jgi:hypothetical protein
MVGDERRWSGAKAPVVGTVVVAPESPTIKPLPELIWPLVRCFLGFGVRLLSCRWIGRVSDWLQPILWALVLTAPIVATIFRWRFEGTLWGDVVFCLTFLVSGCAAGGLIHDGLRARRVRREEEEAERAKESERFRRILVRELQTRKIRDFDFSALVEEQGTRRFEADTAAAAVFRHFSNQVVADGVITDEERARMDRLARMLEIDPARVAVIEAAAKAERFRSAVDEVLADGVVTEEESRWLESLRISLGVDRADWSKEMDRIQATDAISGIGEGGVRNVR